MNKANAVSDLGDNRAAVTLYDQAIAIPSVWSTTRAAANSPTIWPRLYEQGHRGEALGDNRAAVTLYDQAIAIRERLVNDEGHSELANDLANAYMNKASAVRDLGDNRAAVTLYDQAIAIRERLVNNEGRRELANDLADGLCEQGQRGERPGRQPRRRDAVRPGHR